MLSFGTGFVSYAFDGNSSSPTDERRGYTVPLPFGSANVAVKLVDASLAALEFTVERDATGVVGVLPEDPRITFTTAEVVVEAAFPVPGPYPLCPRACCCVALPPFAPQSSFRT